MKKLRMLLLSACCVFAPLICAADEVALEENVSNAELSLAENQPSDLPDATVAQADNSPAAPSVTSAAAAKAADSAPTCAQKAFADALLSDSSSVSETSSEFKIQSWIYTNFGSADTIKKVLACPEIAAMDEEDSIAFPPVAYRFSGGREIIVNYETQPKVLHQRLLISNKRALPDSDPSPNIGDPNSPDVWTNTDPAWYGILVVQAGALDQFVGEDKNNVISVRYFEDHFSEIYPKNHNTTKVWQAGGAVTVPMCTSVSAFADDNDIVNIAATKTVGVEDDSSEYYVAGLANLQWVSWAQVAFDVAITVATVGGGTVIMGLTKGIRAAKEAKDLAKIIKAMQKGDKVADYLDTLRSAARAAEDLKKIDKVKDAAKYAEKTEDIKKLAEKAKGLENLDDLKKYREAVKVFDKVMDLRRGLKAWKIPQRGNVIARGFRGAKGVWKTLRALKNANTVLKKGSKVARAGMKSGKIRNWLFHSSLKNAGRLAKMERSAGLLYGLLKFGGDMYDWTEISTGEFTSNIEFKPLGLLSADNIKGQENVVNHGMWLMWAGDSMSPEDDDAAYLQAMDFAQKFYQDMEEVQDDLSDRRSAGTMCNVDIYVVRPIVRNPDSDDEQLYYLIMNDAPWHVGE
jgi:tetratricopeptide (TPR) repeat protein